MEELGDDEPDGQWRVRYQRCQTCGFTVRLLVCRFVDPEQFAALRRTLLSARLRTIAG
jgi:hypothetical protein